MAYFLNRRLRKIIFSVTLIFISISGNAEPARYMYIDGVKLVLGMPSMDAISLLSKKFSLSSFGDSGFLIRSNSKNEVLGNVAFKNEKLTYICKTIDTKNWPADEGFSVGHAIYSAIDAAIEKTDSDGFKRSEAKILISSQEGLIPEQNTSPKRINIKTIAIYVGNQKIVVSIDDGEGGKSISANAIMSLNPM